MPDWLQTAAGNTSDFVGDVFDDVGDFFGATADAVSNGLNDFAEWSGLDSVDSIESFIEWRVDLQDSVFDWLGDQWNSVSGWVADQWDSLSDWTQDLIKSIVNVIVATVLVVVGLVVLVIAGIISLKALVIAAIVGAVVASIAAAIYFAMYGGTDDFSMLESFLWTLGGAITGAAGGALYATGALAAIAAKLSAGMSAAVSAIGRRIAAIVLAYQLGGASVIVSSLAATIKSAAAAAVKLFGLGFFGSLFGDMIDVVYIGATTGVWTFNPEEIFLNAVFGGIIGVLTAGVGRGVISASWPRKIGWAGFSGAIAGGIGSLRSLIMDGEITFEDFIINFIMGATFSALFAGVGQQIAGKLKDQSQSWIDSIKVTFGGITNWIENFIKNNIFGQADSGTSDDTKSNDNEGNDKD